MNKFIKSQAVFGILFSAISANTFADTMQDTIKHCTNIADLAGSVMESVQMDMSYETLTKTQSPAVMPLMNALYTNAMSEPSMHSDEGKDRQVKDFKRVWFTLCMQESSKGA